MKVPSLLVAGAGRLQERDAFIVSRQRSDTLLGASGQVLDFVRVCVVQEQLLNDFRVSLLIGKHQRGSGR